MKNNVLNQVYSKAMDSINLATVGNTLKAEPVNQKAPQIR